MIDTRTEFIWIDKMEDVYPCHAVNGRFTCSFDVALGLEVPERRLRAKDAVIRIALGDYSTELKVERVIFNDKTTIVFWNDHTKTVVKCQEGDTFSEEAGVALCFMKKMLGNKGNYNKVLREALEKAQRQGE